MSKLHLFRVDVITAQSIEYVGYDGLPLTTLSKTFTYELVWYDNDVPSTEVVLAYAKQTLKLNESASVTIVQLPEEIDLPIARIIPMRA